MKEFFGPPLPPKMKVDCKRTEDEDSLSPKHVLCHVTKQIVDPAKPLIGPKVCEQVQDSETIDEERKKEIQEKMLRLENQKSEIVHSSQSQREEWMTELPEKFNRTKGVSANSFSRKSYSATDNEIEEKERQQWQKKPGVDSKNSSKDRKKRRKRTYDKERDVELENIAKKHNKQRGKPLKDIHDEKKKNEKPRERVPFDRERDMKMERVSVKRSQEFMKNATKDLNSRFSNATTMSKFL